MVVDDWHNASDMATGEPLERLIEQATDWLLRIEESPGDKSVRAAADTWRAADPERARAWAQAERAYLMFAASRPGIQPEPLAERRGGARRRSSSRRWLAGAAGALAACLLLLYVPGMLTHLRADIVTATAELRQVTLEDGSTVVLAPRTAIDVRFSPERRTVRLLSGQAFFEVVSQRSRPFDVQAGDLTVTVAGTAFDVRLSNDALVVGVQHGAVEIQSLHTVVPLAIRLGPGDQVTVGRRDGVVRRATVPPEEVASWRDYKLFVEGATVGDVVDELRRYRSGWIVFADRTLERQQITGLYDLRDPDRALRALVGPFGAHVREITPLLTVVSGP